MNLCGTMIYNKIKNLDLDTGMVGHDITATCFLNSDKPRLIKTIPLHTERIKSGKQLKKKKKPLSYVPTGEVRRKKKVTNSQIVEKQ